MTHAGAKAGDAWRGTLAILLLTLVVYWPAYFAGFHWDDGDLFLKQPLITQPGGLWKIWFSTEPLDYIPLTSTMFWIEYRLFGENPMPYHVVNVFLHAVGAVLLWLALRRLAVPAAWLGAALFAIHPVTVSTAAWISEGKNTLSMSFAMASLAAMTSSGAFDQQRVDRRWYAFSLFLFLLALLAKAAVVMLAPTLLVLIWWKRGRLSRADVVNISPYFVMSLVFGLITVWFQTFRAIGEIDPRPEGWPSRIAGIGWCAWFYLSKALVPVQLTMVYPRWDIPGDAISMVPLLLLVLVYGALLAMRNHFPWGRGLVAAVTIYGLNLLPVLGLVKMSFYQFSLVADHLQYFGLPAITALMGAGLVAVRDQGWLQARPVQIVAGLAVLTFSGLTFAQARLYENYETLWTDVIRKNPGIGVAYYLRGWGRAQANQFLPAEQDMRRAVELGHADAELYTHLAALIESRGRHDEAIDLLRRAVTLFPSDVRVHNNLGSSLVRANRMTEALEAFDRAIALKPKFVELAYSRGYVLARLGEREQAIQSMRRALELDPDHVRALMVLGMLYAEQGQLPDAQASLERAHQLAPTEMQAILLLAQVYLRQGRRVAALSMATKAQRLSPHDPAVRQILDELAQSPTRPGP